MCIKMIKLGIPPDNDTVSEYISNLLLVKKGNEALMLFNEFVNDHGYEPRDLDNAPLIVGLFSVRNTSAVVELLRKAESTGWAPCALSTQIAIMDCYTEA